MTSRVRPQPHIESLPGYVPGRSAEAAMATHGLQAAIKLASNESAFGPLRAAEKAIEHAVADVPLYPDHRAVRIRAALADRLSVDVDRVTVGCGSVGLIQQLCLAYAGPGDEVLMGWPSFEAYPVFAAQFGASAVKVPLKRQTIDLCALAEAMTDRTRLVFIATPNNPTGTALRTRELLALAGAVPDDCLLVIDEAYREFVTGADVPDGLGLLGERPNVVILRTFSKAYGLAGLRVGYMIAHPDVVSTVDKVLVPFAVNRLAQEAALASLGETDELAERLSRTRAERARVRARLGAMGLPTPDAQGNFVWLPAAAKARSLAAELEKRGVVTRSFDDVGVRVTTGTPEQNDQFLEALSEVASTLDLSGDWELPTGEEAKRADMWLARLDNVAGRLIDHAQRHHSGRTDPDSGTAETWDAANVWGHLAEFGRYWLDELDLVLDGTDGQPFGRTKTDPTRIAAVNAGSASGVHEHLTATLRAIDALQARLSEMTTADWSRTGVHPTLGEMDIDAQLQHFHIGHYEEHLAQLDSLGTA